MAAKFGEVERKSPHDIMIFDTSLPSAAARDAAAVALRGSERGMAKMERSGN